MNISWSVSDSISDKGRLLATDGYFVFPHIKKPLKCHDSDIKIISNNRVQEYVGQTERCYS